MPGIVFKLFGIAILAISIVYMIASAFRQSRRLDARIRQLRKEQEEAARSGKVQDPYAALAELYQEQSRRIQRSRPLEEKALVSRDGHGTASSLQNRPHTAIFGNLTR